MPITTLKNGPNKGEARKRVSAEGDAKPPKLRSKRSDTGGAHASLRAGEDQPRPERSRRAMDSGPRFAGELDDYDEDKP